MVDKIGYHYPQPRLDALAIEDCLKIYTDRAGGTQAGLATSCAVTSVTIYRNIRIGEPPAR